ncbi:MAG: CoA-binding protein [Planctomycetes bacterium]|nr:CoA-binding protein [Planctomycetota bacterium]
MPTVAIVGASPKPDRYSHQAVLRFRERGYTVWPVHPSKQPVAGLTTYGALDELPGRPDIVCMYLNPTAGAAMLDAIAATTPRILWLNPGADGEPIASAARSRGLRVIEACVLVALGRGDPLEIAGPTS